MRVVGGLGDKDPRRNMLRASNLHLQEEAIRAFARAKVHKEIIAEDRCADCGSVGGRIHGHHEDYAKPFEVVWLCRECHWNRHWPLRAAIEIEVDMEASLVREFEAEVVSVAGAEGLSFDIACLFVIRRALEAYLSTKEKAS